MSDRDNLNPDGWLLARRDKEQGVIAQQERQARCAHTATAKAGLMIYCQACELVLAVQEEKA